MEKILQEYVSHRIPAVRQVRIVHLDIIIRELYFTASAQFDYQYKSEFSQIF